MKIWPAVEKKKNLGENEYKYNFDYIQRLKYS
jgi:hypothetical protein